jgi:type I restriction enzyme R subunit
MLAQFLRRHPEALRKQYLNAHDPAESLRNNVSVDWAVRESVRAKRRWMVKRILRKYKYPPVKQEAAVALVLAQAQAQAQAEALRAEWA